MVTKLLANLISATLQTFWISNIHVPIKDVIYPYEIGFEEKNLDLCTNNPELGNQLLSIGRRMGIKIINGIPEMKNKDATYKAVYGQLGMITFLPRPMSDSSRCKLINHEFIHVLQHIKGNLKGVEPLGWQLPIRALEMYGSIQEAEAYTYQNNAGKIIYKLKMYERLNKKK